MERFFTIAGITWRLILPEGAAWDCPDSLAAFSSAGSHWDHTLEFRFCAALPPAEGERVYHSPEKRLYRAGEAWLQYRGAMEHGLDGAYMCLCREGSHTLVYMKEQAFQGAVSTKAVLYGMELEHQIASRDGILLHASWIRWKDRAILFTAPSGVGKSTQAELWCRLRGAELMNGDRTAVFADQGGGVQVRGIPLAGSSGVCQNVQMPLAAIVYLSQAKETTIAPLTGFRAFRSIWEGCSVTALDREDAQRSLQTVMTVLEQIPVYHLACTPDESAVAALEQALREGD